MYIARRRFEAEGQPAPSWLDVFFSIVESRHTRGRTATSGFLYFEPGNGRSRLPWGGDKGPAEGLPIPTLYDCDVELGTEREDKQILSMQVSWSVFRECGKSLKSSSAATTNDDLPQAPKSDRSNSDTSRQPTRHQSTDPNANSARTATHRRGRRTDIARNQHRRDGLVDSTGRNEGVRQPMETRAE